ncbi:Gfo/Idh/MocA family protein [Bacillus cereus]|uniref:Gfo/Idh/MocA family protein n=1 Tax=Bacillus cereus TaxID=1396 RepID=UPI00217E0DCE|nr:Gfo/Idh/MocA family oxidoreductase [Bacillus cereus]MCS6595231.1 Gfo/Idh/MocA family oxidoreductase [Bacillus cereus]
MGEKLFRVGFVGLGGQAKEQAEHVTHTKYGVVTAICDSNLKILEDLPDYLSDAEVFTDYKEMINQCELDAVFICVPHNLHKDIALYALSHGLHVLKEKPLACNYEEGLQIVQASNQYKRSVITLTQRRNHNSYVKAKEMLDSLGDIFLIRGEYTFNGGPYDFGWRGIKDIAGGGAILDMGYHVLDLIVWYFGLPAEVHAYMSNIARPDVTYETEDTAILTFKTHSGALGNLNLSRATQPKKEELFVHGSKGVIHITRTKVTRLNLDGTTGEVIESDRSWDLPIRTQIDDFIQNIKKGIMQDGSSHLDHLLLCDGAYQSVVEKQSVVLEQKELASMKLLPKITI